MRITFVLKQFFRDRKTNAHHTGHFLLDPARVFVRLTFSDSSQQDLPLIAKNADGQFVVDIDPDDVPGKPDGTGTVHKLLVTRLLMDFFVDFPYESNVFRLLRIVQQFTLTPLPTNSDLSIDYSLAPLAWAHSLTPMIGARRSNAGVHPLLDLGKLNRNEIGINALVVDLTRLWDHLHRKNKWTQYYKALTQPTKVAFKVFGHLGGNAFIWYAIVPAYLANSSKVSPHVFYSPSDFAMKQNKINEREYLLDNDDEFDAKDTSDTAYNGRDLLFGYLLPPVDDVRIPSLPSTVGSDTTVSFRDIVKLNWRNVVFFKYTDTTKKKITLRHWSIGAGFERAFYGLGKVKPQQILLLPQVVGTTGAVKGIESERYLNNVTDAILDVLQTNTDRLLAARKDEVIVKDKTILSCYSESGFDLWKSSAINADRIKAIIGIEPNSVNPQGQRVIPGLLQKKVKVFIIGRHMGFNNHYRPVLPESQQKQIRFLPDEPLKIFKYPPDPDSNDFVKYRTARVQSKTLDPLMSTKEKSLLDDLAARSPPIAGKKAISVIFTELANSDRLGAGGVTAIFYNHHFALTGGQEMKLADPASFYNKPVEYRTFFQQAVEEIG